MRDDVRDRLIRTSQWMVRIAVLVNRIFFAAVTVGFTVSLTSPAFFARLLDQPGSVRDLLSIVVAVRWLLMFGAVLAILVDRFLANLADIIMSAGKGSVFLAVNVSRLRTIGWLLLLMQLMDLPALFIARGFPSLSSGLPVMPFSPGGWLAVLMMFVLSRVFAVGSAMRDELEGTV